MFTTVDILVMLQKARAEEFRHQAEQARLVRLVQRGRPNAVVRVWRWLTSRVRRYADVIETKVRHPVQQRDFEAAAEK